MEVTAAPPGPAVGELVGLLADGDPYRRTRASLEPLWLRAANERLAIQREVIPVVGRLADERGVTTIETLDDLVPLLFAHSNYKSYPQSLVTNRRWSLMNRWLDTLSSVRLVDIDVDGVADQDEWIAGLAASGCVVTVSSGTSGKSSFLPSTRADSDFALEALVAAFGRQRGIIPAQDRAVFVLGPKYGPHRSAQHLRTLAEEFGAPGQRFFLSEDPVRASDLSSAADVRRRMVEGIATPSEVADLDRRARESQRAMAARLDVLADEMLARRDEPFIVAGFWGQYWTIMEHFRARGLDRARFHPDTIITGGGGSKGLDLPPDYERQILDFFGIDAANVQSGYGMSELSSACYEVDGRYRIPPWVIPLVLDDAGERLAPLQGATTDGRFAFFDVAVGGRWGGVITGDRVTIDLETPNLSVVPGSIVRYSVANGGDDRLTCAGTIDAYVRGMSS